MQITHKPQDRRANPRYRFYADIEIDWGAVVLWGRVHDISEEGMFIEVPEWPWVPEHFSARLALDTPLPIDCTVRRVMTDRGIGVSIKVTDSKARQRFDMLLRLLRNADDPAAEEHDVLESRHVPSFP